MQCFQRMVTSESARFALHVYHGAITFAQGLGCSYP